MDIIWPEGAHRLPRNVFEDIVEIDLSLLCLEIARTFIYSGVDHVEIELDNKEQFRLGQRIKDILDELYPEVRYNMNIKLPSGLYVRLQDNNPWSRR